MERLTGGITMHRPVTAPAVVLALGNDCDFWAIKAAQEWPVGVPPSAASFSLTVACHHRNPGLLRIACSVCRRTRTKWMHF
jgi:hypothetical protein